MTQQQEQESVEPRVGVAGKTRRLRNTVGDTISYKRRILYNPDSGR